MSEVTLYLADEEAMVAFGKRIAVVTKGSGLIFWKATWGRGRPLCRGASFVGWGMKEQ